MIDLLQGFFSGVLYPLLVIGAMVFLIVSIVYVIRSTNRLDKRLQRGIAAVLPVACLTFVQAFAPVAEASPGTPAELTTQVAVLFIGGGIGGVIVLSAIGAIVRKESDVAATLYVLIVSALTTCFLYLLMHQPPTDVASILLGGVVGASLFVAFRGLPTDLHGHRQGT